MSTKKEEILDCEEISVTEPDNGPLQEDAGESAEAARGKKFSRRAIVAAGWTVPVVMATTMPRAANAQLSATGGGGGHIDM